MSGIRPNKEQFIALVNAPDEGPVVMLNLLKFKPREGASEYNKYGGAAVQMVEALHLRLEGNTPNGVELRVEEPPAAS